MSKLNKSQHEKRVKAINQLTELGITVPEGISYDDVMVKLAEVKNGCVDTTDIKFVLNYNIPDAKEIFKLNYDEVVELIKSLQNIESCVDKALVDYYHIIEFGMLSAAKLNHLSSIMKTLLNQRRKSKFIYPKVIEFSKMLQYIENGDDKNYIYRTGLLALAKEPKES